MNCTRCRHQGRTTLIAHLDKHGRKWCLTCQLDADWISSCAASWASHRVQLERAGIPLEDEP